MSSYHFKGHSKASSKPRPDYPTIWNDYEYQYRDSTSHQSPEQRQDIPRTQFPEPTSVNTIATSSNPNSAPSNYTTDPVDTVTRDFAKTDLGGTASPVHHIETRNPNTSEEKFDPNYRVHAEKEFKWGKVFKVLWTEPKGNGQGKGGNSSYTEDTHSVRLIKRGKYEEEHFEKVRRFVIISQKRGHCICLPINTYSGQGTNRRGVHAEDHAIIYTTEKPILLSGEREKGLTRDSIKVLPMGSRHKLDKSSRINYAKVYTVECNVKVWFIGKIHPNFEGKIVADYNLVHPPLTAPNSYLPSSSEDTYAHALGGTSGPYYPGDGGGFGAGTAGSNSYYQGGTWGGASSYSQGGGAASMLAPTGSSSYAPSGGAADDLYEADTSSSYRHDQNPTSYTQNGVAYTQNLRFGGYTQGDSSGSYDQSGGSARYSQQRVSSGYTQNDRADPGPYSSHPSTIPSSMSMSTIGGYRTTSGSYDPRVMSSGVPASSYPTDPSYHAGDSTSRPAGYSSSCPPESQYTSRGHTSSSNSSQRSRDDRKSSKEYKSSGGGSRRGRDDDDDIQYN
ncbi:hypothetical protein LAWI1_G001880 [Lachnellula willkommii]|uniref:DUF6590 domain-containing protein n=1 Tax=Lachnellula willkommii TaxID=215461 RepID=A0A559MLQ1_9HELO|nr:hypothetical protein LAWI1_G001880 [Lachnellula willkommii]